MARERTWQKHDLTAQKSLLEEFVGGRLRLDDFLRWFGGAHVDDTGVDVDRQAGVVLPDSALVRAVGRMRNV